MGHQNLLEQYLRGEIKEGTLSIGQVADCKIAEKLDQPEVSPDMESKDVFLLAANREKASIHGWPRIGRSRAQQSFSYTQQV